MSKYLLIFLYVCNSGLKEHQQLKHELFPQEGDDMLASSHPAKGKIKPRIKDVDDSWDQLLSNCKEKKLRLLEAYQVQHAKTQAQGISVHQTESFPWIYMILCRDAAYTLFPDKE